MNRGTQKKFQQKHPRSAEKPRGGVLTGRVPRWGGRFLGGNFFD